MGSSRRRYRTPWRYGQREGAERATRRSYPPTVDESDQARGEVLMPETVTLKRAGLSNGLAGTWGVPSRTSNAWPAPNAHRTIEFNRKLAL